MTQSLTVGDLKFFYEADSAATLGPGDIKNSGSTPYLDPGFETYVLLCLFTNARASDQDTLPEEDSFREGWWGSALLEFELGSKLWLLNKAKINNDTIALAEQYIKEALKPMIDDGIASKIEATVTRGRRNDELNYLVRVFRKDAENVFFTFYTNWEYQILGVAE